MKKNFTVKTAFNGVLHPYTGFNGVRHLNLLLFYTFFYDYTLFFQKIMTS